MTSRSLKLGFVAIARPTFDIPLAREVIQQARDHLTGAGFTLEGPPELVSSTDDAAGAVRLLAEDPPDLLVVFQATFADSTPALALAEGIDAPLVLWAIPEASTGGRLRLNSLCGINLAAHSLTRVGRRYATIYAAPGDPAALDRVRALAQAGNVRRRLRGTRIGRVGEHPAGFDTCRLDRVALRRIFGLDVVQVDLETLFEKVRAADPQAVSAVEQDLAPRLDGMADVDQTALRRTLGTYVTLRDFATQERLAGYAVRCWPEFFTGLGCAACGSSSLLNDEMMPASCETDVNGTVTQLILQWLSGEPAFGSDVVSFDMEANTAVFWHCGKAPFSMADPQTRPRATIHSNRQLPLLMEFPLKPGRLTLARLSQATGRFRLVIGGGEVLRAPISFGGTSGVVRFDSPAADVLDTILSEGLEHHLALTYGDHRPALEALAHMLDLPVLRL
jgi:L-fucose isomerase-like protein